MSTRDTLQGRIDDSDRRARGRGLSRYDLFLFVLPLPLLVGLGWAAVTPATFSTGAGLGSLPSALLLAYGLFLGGPTPAPSTESESDGDGEPTGAVAPDR